MENKNKYDVPTVRGWVPFRVNEENKNSVDKIKNETSEKVDIDPNWKDKALTKEEVSGGRLFCESSKTIKYPKSLDDYFKDCLGKIQQTLKPYNMKVSLDRLQGEITVSTTMKTYDPVSVLYSMHFLELICRYVPIDEAAKVLLDEYSCDIVNVPDNRDKYRKRLEEKVFLDMFEKSTNCKLFIYGKTICVVGPEETSFEAGNIIRQVLNDKKLPLHALQRYELTKHLRSKPELKNENWSKYYEALEPKKKNVKRKKKKNVTKVRSHLPPPPQPSKIDKMLEDGTFHANYQKEQGKRYYRPVEKIAAKEKRKRDEDSFNDESKKKKKRTAE